MSALAIFEEVRFVAELFFAEIIFILPRIRESQTPHNRRWIKCGLTLVIISAISTLYIPLVDKIPSIWISKSIQVLIWYIVLALILMITVGKIYELGISETMYVGIAGYSTQHLIYIMIHEVIAIGLFPQIKNHFVIYVLLSLVTTGVMYYLIYYIFSPLISQFTGNEFEDSLEAIVINILLLIVLMTCTFGGQSVFRNTDLLYMGAIMGGMVCILVLGIQYISLKYMIAGRDQASLEQMLRDSERHYSFSSQIIEQVNRSAHDIKHTLRAMNSLSDDTRKEYIDRTLENIETYQQMVYTGNEVLNTILYEKNMYAKGLGTTLNISAGDIDLSFIEIIDLYTLLGNILDNAIEGAAKINDEKRRIVNLTIQKVNNFISIQSNNYYKGTIVVNNGLIATTKRDGGLHGYGMKSIRNIVKKYSGEVAVDISNSMYSLQIMFPIQ